MLAEDSVLLREGLVRLLTDEGFDVVGAYGDAGELQAAIRTAAPDIAIVDVRLPPTYTDEGLRAAHQLRRKHPNIGVLVLSQHVEPRLAVTLLSESAEGVGYLLKDRISDVDDFIDAIRRVATGGSALDPAVVDLLISAQRGSAAVAHLTKRERQVLELMGCGRSNQGIADAMGITLRATEKYVSSVFGKLGIPATGSESRRVLAVLLYLRL
jgi:DNA-binding NarL/FixJ family response regulator